MLGCSCQCSLSVDYPVLQESSCSAQLPGSLYLLPFQGFQSEYELISVLRQLGAEKNIAVEIQLKTEHFSNSYSQLNFNNYHSEEIVKCKLKIKQ